MTNNIEIVENSRVGIVVFLDKIDFHHDFTMKISQNRDEDSSTFTVKMIYLKVFPFLKHDDVYL